MTAPVQIKRYPVRGAIWGLLLGLGIAIYLLIFSVITFGDWVSTTIAVAAGVVIGFVWSMFAPAKKAKGAPPAQIGGGYVPAGQPLAATSPVQPAPVQQAPVPQAPVQQAPPQAPVQQAPPQAPVQQPAPQPQAPPGAPPAPQQYAPMTGIPGSAPPPSASPPPAPPAPPPPPSAPPPAAPPADELQPSFLTEDAPQPPTVPGAPPPPAAPPPADGVSRDTVVARPDDLGSEGDGDDDGGAFTQRS